MSSLMNFYEIYKKHEVEYLNNGVFFEKMKWYYTSQWCKEKIWPKIDQQFKTTASIIEKAQLIIYEKLFFLIFQLSLATCNSW